MAKTAQPNFKDERYGLVHREDHEKNLAEALRGNVGIPSAANKFVTVDGLPIFTAPLADQIEEAQILAILDV